MIIEVIHMQDGVSNATLTAYIQDSPTEVFPESRPAIIICPGGAYIGITEKETEPVAIRFLAAGYQAFVLRYSIGAELARFPAPFIDAAKAVMIVRENARRWCVNPDKICLCGFSTGGQVAAILAATWQEDYLANALKADNQLFKPNALLLGYPLLDMYQFNLKNLDKSPEMNNLLEMIYSTAYGSLNPSKQLMEEWNCKNRITSYMSPTYLWRTAEDAFVDVQDSLDFIRALSVNNIPYEFHFFEKGAHGLSLGDQTVGYSEADMRKHGNVHKWVELGLNWLKTL
ncbi:MAG: alpha/beta hydrolase [Mobilitalea sp.]